MPWAAISLVVGLIAVATMLLARRDDPPAEMSADQWITMGIVFTGAGVVMAIAMGPWMIPMIAIGIVYLAMGARKKRGEP